MVIELIRIAGGGSADHISEKSKSPVVLKRVVVRAADVLIGKMNTIDAGVWVEEGMDRSVSATKLFDVVEDILFDKSKDNGENDGELIAINTRNILAEVSSNVEMKSELSFPSGRRGDDDERGEEDVDSGERAFVKIEKPGLW